MGCDRIGSDTRLQWLVSIHAPTWGATSHRDSGFSTGYGFNPRTHVGCDPIVVITTYLCIGFNPRTHVGCDHVRGPQICRTADVSIHAPTWGATPRGRWNIAAETFQSTHPRGVRPGHQQKNGPVQQVSIHAPTWGATFSIQCLPRNLMGFNPRTHVGCDPIIKSWVSSMEVSIHAPTWGATELSVEELLRWAVSIHAPTWGATSQVHDQRAYPDVSIHAPTWGATNCANILAQKLMRFNPRTHVGCDLCRAPAYK